MCSKYSHLICRTLFSHLWAVALCQSIHEMKIEILFTTHPALARCTRNKIDAHRRTIPAWRRVIRSLCHCHSMRPSNQIYLSNQSTYSSIYSSLLFSPSFHSMRGLSALYCLTMAHRGEAKKILYAKAFISCSLSIVVDVLPPPRCPHSKSHTNFFLINFQVAEKKKEESGEKLFKCFRTTSKLCSERRLDSRVEWAEQQRQLDETMVPIFSRRSSAATWLAFQVCRLETRSTGWGATARVESKRVWEVEGNL